MGPRSHCHRWPLPLLCITPCWSHYAVTNFQSVRPNVALPTTVRVCPSAFQKSRLAVWISVCPPYLIIRALERVLFYLLRALESYTQRPYRRPMPVSQMQCTAVFCLVFASLLPVNGHMRAGDGV